MKTLKMGLLLLMLFSLMSAICYGQTAEDYYDKGMEYGVVGEFEKARQEFAKALEVDPFYEPVRIGLKLSEDVLTQRIKVETAIYLFKGIDYDNKKMFDESIAEFRKAIEINPNYAEAYHNLGLVYHHKAMFDEAIAELKKVIEIDPNLPEAHYNLGVAYHNKGMLDEAIAEYKKAIEINPNYADAHNTLGLAYYSKGMLDEAVAEYRKAIEINPGHAVAHNNLAVAYYSRGEYGLAIKHCDKVIELAYQVHPDFLEALEPYRKR